MAEYRAVFRTLANSQLSFGPLGTTSLSSKSVLLSSDEKKPKNEDNKPNDNKKNDQNRNYNNDEDKEDEENDEPKSSLMAKAIVWMLSGFNFI